MSPKPRVPTEGAKSQKQLGRSSLFSERRLEEMYEAVMGSRLDLRLRSTRPSGESLTSFLVDAIQSGMVRADQGKTAKADWTCFVLLNADNNLEKFGKADLNEMERVGSLPSKLNMIALVDGCTRRRMHMWTPGARLMHVTCDASNSRKIRSSEIAVDPKSKLGKLLAAGKGELDMGSPEVLHAALDYVQRNYESNHFMVDLWNHGAGWRGISFDDTPPSDDNSTSDDNLSPGLDMHDLRKAFSGLPKKVDILAADACLMATIEVADTAKAVGADWLVGSEELSPGTGWNYADLMTRMSKLFNGKTEVSSEQMVKAILESYATGPRGNVTMSATNLSKLDALNDKLNDFSDALLSVGGLLNKEVRTAYEKALRFDDKDQMDLGDFAKRASQGTTDSKVKEAAAQLLAALAQSTLATGANRRKKYKAATGLSIYAPLGAVDSEYQKAGAAWLSNSWNEVITTYL